jgi:CheY-like chemotaxis protein
MGGQIGYRENPGGGSVFWVDLPAGVAQEAATPDDETAAPADRPLRILVVDDSEVHRDLATAYLTRAGHSVVEAADGDAGVQLADAEDFDVILMDIRMPGIGGLEATRKIRALQGRRRAVPVIAVTADALDTDLEECRRASLLDHLSKPFTEPELLAAIAKARQRYAQTPETSFQPLSVKDATPLLMP